MIFRRVGNLTEKFLASGILFFRFAGHLYESIVHAFQGKVKIPWGHVWETIYSSGARLVIPLMIISAMAGPILALNIHYLMVPYGLQSRAPAIAITAMYRDLVPLLIGVVICIHSALNLLTIEAQKLRALSPGIVFEYLFPIVFGINISALMLYFWLIAACLGSTGMAFHYLLRYNAINFVIRMSSLIHFSDIFWSIFKTAIYCTLVSMTVGYYYYEVAVHNIQTRKAVSRIITRGLFWIMLSSIYFKFFTG